MESGLQIRPDLYNQALSDLADRFDRAAQDEKELPSEWLQKYFWIPEPRDPLTDQLFPPGPIRLAEHQIRIIDEALSKTGGRLKYTTIIYSAPKKSGKSGLSSGVALRTAWKNPYSNVYCLANDNVQSNDRLYLPAYHCIKMHQQIGGLLSKVRANEMEAKFPNMSVLKAVPTDAAGEAGAEPLASFWSEIWAFDTERKRRLWVEMTVPPTKFGRAFRWVESYAGYLGQSDLLWQLYQLAVKEGEPHPDFADLVGRKGEPVVWINHTAKLFAYWDTAGRMAWQTQAFYMQDAKILPPTEFNRVHYNEWATSLTGYVQPEWWDACRDSDIPPLSKNTPVVMGVDAAISGDCAAIVLVSRHPRQPETDTAVRYCKIIKPRPGRPIQIEQDIGREIRRLNKLYNVICIAYDAYQMEGLVQSYRLGNVALSKSETDGMTSEEKDAYERQESEAAQRWYYKFGQQQPRAVADKQLYDMILALQVHWNPHDLDSDVAPRGNEETLTKHIKQAGRKDDNKQMRIEKLAEDAHIDGPVALSMANRMCMRLILDNAELHEEDLLRQFYENTISYDEFIARVRERRRN